MGYRTIAEETRYHPNILGRIVIRSEILAVMCVCDIGCGWCLCLLIMRLTRKRDQTCHFHHFLNNVKLK